MHGFSKKVGRAEERIIKLNDRTLQLPSSNRKEKTFVKRKKQHNNKALGICGIANMPTKDLEFLS